MPTVPALSLENTSAILLCVLQSFLLGHNFFREKWPTFGDWYRYDRSEFDPAETPFALIVEASSVASLTAQRKRVRCSLYNSRSQPC
jgi:hypothetical protein